MDLYSEKVKVYDQIKVFLFNKMDYDQVTPERADEIFVEIKKLLLSINNINEVSVFLMKVAEIYPELNELKTIKNLQEKESADKSVAQIVENFVESGDLEIAEEVMNGYRSYKGDINKFIDQIKLKYSL